MAGRARFSVVRKVEDRGDKPEGKLETLEDIMAWPESKEYQDLRDRAAYILITGSFPTHLRPAATGLLRQISERTTEAQGLDGEGGSIKVRPEYMIALQLGSHPMVRQVRRFLDHDYKLVTSRGLKTRRPFGRVWVYKPLDEEGHRRQEATVQADGSVKEGIQ